MILQNKLLGKRDFISLWSETKLQSYGAQILFSVPFRKSHNCAKTEKKEDQS